MVSDIKMSVDPSREKALADYRKKLLEHKEVIFLFPFFISLFLNDETLFAISFSFWIFSPAVKLRPKYTSPKL